MPTKKVIEYRRGALATINLPTDDAMQMLRNRAAQDQEYNMEDYLLTIMAGGCVQVQDGPAKVLNGADIEIPAFGDRPYII